MCCWKHSLYMISQHTAVNLCPWPLPQQGWHVGGVNTPRLKEEWGPSPAKEASPEALTATALLTLLPDLLADPSAFLGITVDAVLGSSLSPTCLGKHQQNQLTRSTPCASIKWPEQGWAISKTAFWIQPKEWSCPGWGGKDAQNWEDWLLGPNQTFWNLLRFPTH